MRASQPTDDVRDFSRLPESPAPETWTTSMPATPAPLDLEPPIPPDLYWAPAGI